MNEEETPKLSWDHQTFLIEGKPFYPDLSEKGNTLLVRLPCEPHADLNWSIPETSKRILWEFELGLHHPFFPLSDELCFQSLIAALKHFSESIWPRFKEQTLGGILYRGPADFSLQFLWTDQQRENERQWLEEKGNLGKALFCADSFSGYFQLLAHRLPDELPLVLCFDARSIASRAQALNLLSKERFEHFLLAVRAEHWPMPSLRWDDENLWFAQIQSALGICLPQGAAMTEARLKEFDEWMDRLEAPFRVIPEAFLAEQWEGLDEICILPEAMSAQGLRKLKGFSAAGGIILEEIRGRGI